MVSQFAYNDTHDERYISESNDSNDENTTHQLLEDATERKSPSETTLNVIASNVAVT